MNYYNLYKEIVLHTIFEHDTCYPRDSIQAYYVFIEASRQDNKMQIIILDIKFASSLMAAGNEL